MAQHGTPIHVYGGMGGGMGGGGGMGEEIRGRKKLAKNELSPWDEVMFGGGGSGGLPLGTSCIFKVNYMPVHHEN